MKHGFGAPWFLVLPAALMSLLAMHAVYWVLTHPVNGFWLREKRIARTGAGFFAFDPIGRRRAVGHPRLNWTALRDRWEYSHVARAALSVLSLLALLIALHGGGAG